MNVEPLFEHEKLPSGKTIRRKLNKDGSLMEETHGYGLLEIAIMISFEAGRKIDETYFSKGRMVSRRSYEKIRQVYVDMPVADNSIEDFGSSLLSGARKQQRQNKAEAEQRFIASVVSHFPKPENTNWLRVISGEKSHLVIFASRDWKALFKESNIPMGRHWLCSFGFGPVPGSGSIAKGFEIGFEVVGDRVTMLEESKSLLSEVIEFEKNPIETSQWQGSIRPRRKVKRKTLSWPAILPPLIDFLSGLQASKVKIFNHHQ